MNQQGRVQAMLEAVRYGKGPEQEIIGVGRDDLPAFCVAMGYKTGAEVGVFKGEYTELFLKAGLKMYGVDPWMDLPAYHTPGMSARLDEAYDQTRHRLAHYMETEQCTLIRKTSVAAASGFEDDSLDFVYIDGNHEFKHVTEDLYEWSRVVRKGGMIAGHDFVFSSVQPGNAYVCDVKYVVPAWCRAKLIKDWFVLGRMHFPEDKEEIRDKWRSFMWLKK